MPVRTFFLSMVVALSLVSLESAAATQLRIEAGTDADGRMTSQWNAMLRKRLQDRAADFQAPKANTPQEQAWADLIAARARDWEAMVPALAADYAPAQPPAHVRIVTGNRGAEDAFTHDPTTIGFDLSALQANYGDAGTAENRARMDRFFRHEFVHLLQKAWLARHPAPLDTPLQRAAFEMWTEGLGNRESLSSKWADVDGRPSEATTTALAELEPRLVARVAAMACASEPSAAALAADLSNGRFDRKWGALPVALWLQHDAARDPASLRRFIQAGPAGVWALADRHLAPPLRATLREALAAGTRCR